MNTKVNKKILALLQKLHQNAEPSGREFKTREILKDFLSQNTSLVIYEDDSCLLAYKKSKKPKRKTIAFRADIDALTVKGEQVAHLCGHDGHMACLCNFALDIEKEEYDRDIYLLFQTAEENGAGAYKCLNILKSHHIEKFFGFHNIPQVAKGTFVIRENTFACASVGLRMFFKGKVSHAAYPELGHNPAYVISKIITKVAELNNVKKDILSFITPIYINLGNPSFGVAAGEGELCLTIRSEKEEDLKTNVNALLNLAKKYCEYEKITFTYEKIDYFPETYNDNEAYQDLYNAISKINLPYQILKEPMRWSEDFGHFSKIGPSCYFGIGNESEGLHTINYKFNDDIIPLASIIYKQILKEAN